METDAPIAPPVVAVVVVHRPGAWFEETLESLADQDYPNLNTLFLLAGDPVDADGNDLAALITERLPDAFVRPLGANPGFGAAANEVLRARRGRQRVLLHLPRRRRPRARRHPRAGRGAVPLERRPRRAEARLVGRSPASCSTSGSASTASARSTRSPSRASTTRSSTTPCATCSSCRRPACSSAPTCSGPSAGSTSGISFHGDDVDLCWRAHLSGARVVVAPQARVRHREELTVRRPDLHHDDAAGPPPHAPRRHADQRRPPAAAVARARRADGHRAVRRAVHGPPRRGVVVAAGARRPGAADARRWWPGGAPSSKLRRVDDAEILACRTGAAPGCTRYRRAHDTETLHRHRGHGAALAGEPAEHDDRLGRWSSCSSSSASRTMIDTRVPNVGEFLPLPASARDWWADFTSAWNPGGLGVDDRQPDRVGRAVDRQRAVAVPEGLGLTVIVVGLVAARRLGHVAPGDGVPVEPGPHRRPRRLRRDAARAGRDLDRAALGALVAYAAVPWFVHLLRVAAGIGTADPAAAARTSSRACSTSPRERVRRTALLTLATAVAVAIAPAVLPVLVRRRRRARR